jgi:ribosomal protein S18 acetylase RimI-like enzyme
MQSETLPVIRELRTDAEIEMAFPVMAMLRDRIQAGTFLAEVRRQQLQGYELIGAYEGERIVALAGVRRTHTLSRGEHLFVDDLVTDADHRGQGHGRALLRWLAERSAAEGLPRIHLDSRYTAKGFYEKLGFQFSTAVPCFIELG